MAKLTRRVRETLEEAIKPAAEETPRAARQRSQVMTWPKAAEEAGVTVRQLRVYGETPELALEAYWEAAEVAAEGEITDEMAEEAGFASADELIEAAEAEGLDPLKFMEEFVVTAKDRKAETRKPTARREAPAKGKPAVATRKPARKRDEAADEIENLKARIAKAKKEGKSRLAAALQEELDELSASEERMPYPDTGKVVGEGDEAVADYSVFDAEDLKEFGKIRWQNKTDDDGNRLPDRLRATVAFADDQVLTVTVRKDRIGDISGRERGEAVMDALGDGFYAIDFPGENGGNGGLFLDCNPEVSGGRQFKFDEEGRLVWGSKSRTQFFRHARGAASEAETRKPTRTEEPQAQSFRRGKAR